MSNNEELTQKIEQIAVQFVMTEPEETENIQTIADLFHDIGFWAKKNKQPVLGSAIMKFTSCADAHFTCGTLSRDDFVNAMGKFISEIQTHARNEYDFKKIKLPELFETLEAAPSIPETDYPCASSDKISLRHPETLPSHLDYDLFAEFLELQTHVLHQMEELLLKVEQAPDMQAVEALKRILHTQKGEAGFLNLSDIEALCHATEDILNSDSVFQHTDFLFSVIDWLKKSNAWYKGESRDCPEPVRSLIDSISANTDTKPYLTDSIPADEKAPIQETSETLIRQSIRVDTERLDRFIDMIGELVIAQSMVMQSKELQSVKSQELSNNLALMDKITRNLQEASLNLRMVPLKATFQKMERLVRDTAKKSGKSIRFTVQGEETELDKSLVDKIGEPLLHIIRNAVDHGIEESETVRTALGKPPHGTISLTAGHKSGYIHIEISDDGNGLNKASIVRKAKESGLLSDESQVHEQDIFHLIFEPGFSTAEAVTDLSGRGQGMSVVKQVLDSLHAHIDCHSVEGRGCTFILKIPLTLAIIDGMIVKAGKDRFIIPTLSIITTCRLEEKNVTTLISKEKTILVQGSILPLVDLCTCFGIEKDALIKSPDLMVVVESNTRRIALVVDEIIGKQQIVIKNIGDGFKHSPGISGAAIMADGTVGLIIDIDRLTIL